MSYRIYKCHNHALLALDALEILLYRVLLGAVDCMHMQGAPLFKYIVYWLILPPSFRKRKTA